MKASIILLLIAGLISSCTKKEVPVKAVEYDCYDFPVGNLVDWPGVKIAYSNPRFNPKNSNEIIYLKGIVGADTTCLVKRNLISNSETTVVAGAWSKADWNVNDWIVFNHSDNQLWKIKSGGDSLTLLTTDMEGGFDAVCSSDGSKIAFVKKPGNNRYTIIADMLGKHLDTLPYFEMCFNRWSQSNFVCAPSEAGIKYLNLNTRQINVVFSNVLDNHLSNLVYGYALDWTQDSKFIIWADHYGIFKTDITTGMTTKIKTTCDSKYYSSLSVSLDGSKIIAQRVDQYMEGTSTYIKFGLSLIDMNGNETKITNTTP